MSTIVETGYGRMRLIAGAHWRDNHWLLEVPNCGKWEPIGAEQLRGEVSVNHAAVCGCGYHETHPYGRALVAAIQQRVDTGDWTALRAIVGADWIGRPR